MAKQNIEYDICGTAIQFSGECGLYKKRENGKSWDYVAMRIGDYVEAINATSKHRAIKQATQLRDLAKDQATWGRHTSDVGSLFVKTGGTQALREVLQNIRNTEHFAGAVLRALQGE